MKPAFDRDHGVVIIIGHPTRGKREDERITTYEALSPPAARLLAKQLVAMAELAELKDPPKTWHPKL